ncbi:NAD dependent epimerase/dehydratase family protein [Acanthocheilonema viteae]
MTDELNYLIVGGLSYIGLHIAEYLLEKYPNVKLTILDLSSNTAYTNEILKKIENYPQQCTVIIGSSGNCELATKILEKRKISTVLYNVWSHDVSVTAAKKDYPGCFRKTLSCLTQFLEVLRCYGKLTKFILISSEAVYGKQTLKLETTATKPCSFKGAAINACEMMLHSYIISYRIPALTVRLSAVIYGGVMDDNLLLHLQHDDNEKSETVGLLHIQDAVLGIGAALEKGHIGEVYNIGGQCDCSPHFFQLIAKFKKGEISSDEISVSMLTMPSMKAELELLWKAKISQSEGMHEIMVKNESYWNRMDGANTHKILVYGTDFALKRLSRLIENKKRYLPESLQKENIILSKRPFDSNDIDINEIIDVSPSHIVYINIPSMSEVATEDMIDIRTLLKTKLYAMLYSPWFLASFCDKRSIHFTYLTSYNIFGENFFCLGCQLPNIRFELYNYLMAIDKFADRLLQHFDTILFCRARIVIDKEDEFDKTTCFGMESSFYLSFLSDCIPRILDLALEGHTGMVDVLNPIPLDDYDFREACNRGNRPPGASIEFLSKE